MAVVMWGSRKAAVEAEQRLCYVHYAGGGTELANWAQAVTAPVGSEGHEHQISSRHVAGIYQRGRGDTVMDL
jgi:hypothetical protein